MIRRNRIDFLPVGHDAEDNEGGVDSGVINRNAPLVTFEAGEGERLDGMWDGGDFRGALVSSREGLRGVICDFAGSFQDWRQQPPMMIVPAQARPQPRRVSGDCTLPSSSRARSISRSA